MEQLVMDLVRSKKSNDQASFVTKRDGHVAEFDASKIASAVIKAFEATGEGNYNQAWEITAMVVSKLEQKIVDIENIQDIVEDTLMNMGFRKTAKSYILYRAKRSELRNINKTLGDSLNM